MTPASTQHDLVLEGAAVRVHTAGAGPATYVLVHGLGVSSRYFRPLADELSQRAVVHTVDLPGHGGVPAPGRPLSVPDYARVLWAALGRLGVGHPVLVGHSMGAQVVVEMAVAGPPVAGVVLLGPTTDAAARGAWRQAARLGRDTLREPPSVNAIVFTDYLFRCGPAWYLQGVPALLGYRIEDAIGAVAAPVVIARGEHDPIAPRRWVDELARRRPGTATAEVPGEAHVLMMRSAPEVAGLCRRVVDAR